MRQWFAIALLVGSAGTTYADSAADREKRRQHVPYVRAATDCISNHVGQASGFPTAVEADNFRPLTATALQACFADIANMVRMHDVIYGSGGSDFFSGPYLADLDRAVRSRLSTRIAAVKLEAARLEDLRRTELARQAAERAEAQARDKAARAERLAMAKKVRDVVRDKTMACIGYQAAPMLVTDEKAEVIAKAAMLFCEGEVNALIAATVDIIQLDGELTNEGAIRLAARKRVEEVVTAQVVRAKGELILQGQQRGNQPAPTPSPTL